MDNFNLGLKPAILDGSVRWGLRSDKKLQMIASMDIGAFVALAFSDPDHFLGRALELAGDELTMPGAMDVFAEALGHPAHYEAIPVEEAAGGNPDMAAMLRWFNQAGYHADIPELITMYPPLMNLRSWIHQSGWAPGAPSQIQQGFRSHLV